MGHRHRNVLEPYYTMHDDTAEAAMATKDYAAHRPSANTQAS